MHSKSYDCLIGHIYDTALEEGGWQDLFKEITQELKAESSILRLMDLDTNDIHFFEHFNYNPRLVEKYKSYYVKLDMYNHGLKSTPAGQVIRGQDFISDKDLVKTEIYNDYFRHLGRFHVAGGSVLRIGSKAAIFGIQRNRQAGAFSDRELGTLRQIFPHLKRALSINQRLEHISNKLNMFSCELDNIPTGLVFIDSSGNIIDLNTRASSFINEHPHLRIKHKKLSIQNLELHKKLESMVDNLIALSRRIPDSQTAEDAICVPGTDGTPTIHILSSPLTNSMALYPSLEMQDIAGVLILGTPERRHHIPDSILKSLFGLSKAESRLLNKIITGADLKEISQDLYVSQNTIRSQLKSIFRKTGVNRQADLIKLIYTSPASLYLKRKNS